MKIYMINLDRSPERLKYMDKQLRRLNLEYERIPAVDGRQLVKDNLLEKVANVDRIREWPNLLTPNVIGCSLSHYNTYRKIAEGSDDFVLILEDDIKITGDLKKLLNVISGKLLDTDIYLIYFHGQPGEQKKFVSRDRLVLNEQFSFYKAYSIWGAYSTAGYIISKKIAQKLVSYVYPIHTTADSWGMYYRDGIINGLWALCPLIAASTTFQSTIGYETSRLKKIAKQIPLIYTVFRKFNQLQIQNYEIIDAEENWKNEI